MKKLIFEWDDRKNASNNRKYGVSFEEAQTVFFDEKAIEFDDPDHSIKGDRFVIAIALMKRQFALFQQEKRPKENKVFIPGGCYEKGI